MFAQLAEESLAVVWLRAVSFLGEIVARADEADSCGDCCAGRCIGVEKLFFFVLKHRGYCSGSVCSCSKEGRYGSCAGAVSIGAVFAWQARLT